ncbi:MAG: hypothetical protein FJY75_09325 [Candidatus Eisenbacteria bacterium]|uniref:Uncharacterized protein n=1 Tax=Eiseniibacteriota bacterium TaxID=2212470 RepID=A0A937X8V0_UNCEI|nr:hypothetical protein [Candidatus Eisenbacteria bacterium]
MTGPQTNGAGPADAGILEALKPHIQEDLLPCRAALALAAELGVSPARIGKVCNAHGIRIVDCQLGCFGRARKLRD